MVTGCAVHCSYRGVGVGMNQRHVSCFGRTEMPLVKLMC